MRWIRPVFKEVHALARLLLHTAHSFREMPLALFDATHGVPKRGLVIRGH